MKCGDGVTPRHCTVYAPIGRALESGSPRRSGQWGLRWTMAPASREMRGIGLLVAGGLTWDRCGGADSHPGLSGPLTLRLFAPNRHAANAMTLLSDERRRRNHGGTHAGLSGSRAAVEGSERVAFSDDSSGTGLRTHGPRSAGPKRNPRVSCLRLQKELCCFLGYGQILPCRRRVACTALG